MPCYHPIEAYRTQEKTSTGKLKIVFSKSAYSTHALIPVKLPCQQCHGCRLEKSRQWATRCLHESTLHNENSFITLTYDDEHLPWDHSLNIEHFQKFMRRLRKAIAPKKIRFYHSGEYGKATPDNDFIARPHYHALIFGHNFSDRTLWTEREGICLYTSADLDDLWNMGITSVGDVTFESAAYVARYIMKKINGAKADDHYTRTDHATGEIIKLQPEYSTMSRRSGIGANWFNSFKSDAYPSDKISVRGSIQKPPKYYDYLYNLDSPYDMERIKQERKKSMRKHLKDNTPDRLAVREQVKLAQTSTLNRSL